MSDCQCPVAGWCERYKRRMGERAHSICQGTSGLDEAKTAAYRENWLRASTPPSGKARFISPPYRGPGTILKDIFSWFISENGKCGCKSKARRMDCKGPEWCEENFDLIIGWLRESAEKLNVPFFETPARVALQWAISQSKYERSLVEEGA